MPDGVRVLSSSNCHSFAALGDVLLFFWHGEVTVASIRATRVCQLEMTATYPHGVRVLAVVAAGTPVPSVEARVIGATIDREFQTRVLAHATVVPGEGFWVATARSVLAAVFALSRTKYPRRVFGRSNEALIWLAPRGALKDLSPLRQHVEQLEAAHYPGIEKVS